MAAESTESAENEINATKSQGSVLSAVADVDQLVTSLLSAAPVAPLPLTGSTTSGVGNGSAGATMGGAVSGAPAYPVRERKLTTVRVARLQQSACVS